MNLSAASISLPCSTPPRKPSSKTLKPHRERGDFPASTPSRIAAAAHIPAASTPNSSAQARNSGDPAAVPDPIKMTATPAAALQFANTFGTRPVTLPPSDPLCVRVPAAFVALRFLPRGGAGAVGTASIGLNVINATARQVTIAYRYLTVRNQHVSNG